MIPRIDVISLQSIAQDSDDGSQRPLGKQTTPATSSTTCCATGIRQPICQSENLKP